MPSGGNFSPELEINDQGHILPTGPLEVPQDGSITKLYAWVFQLKPDGTGAMCVASQEKESFEGLAPGQNVWAAKAGAIHEGWFDPGPAVGMAVLISRDADGRPLVYWWSENIRLKKAPPPANPASAKLS